ncbi:UNVERIFIED_CONTAM: hypothetical protein Sradi_3821200 [Sesamum radiatum]|uniref:Uncharacterized protein n=1 Tax=Sesamum radiatum TaxID=300843 RepID=A0AAW2Q0Y1_SESRA
MVELLDKNWDEVLNGKNCSDDVIVNVEVMNDILEKNNSRSFETLEVIVRSLDPKEGGTNAIHVVESELGRKRTQKTESETLPSTPYNATRTITIADERISRQMRLNANYLYDDTNGVQEVGNALEDEDELTPTFNRFFRALQNLKILK